MVPEWWKWYFVNSTWESLIILSINIFILPTPIYLLKKTITLLRFLTLSPSLTLISNPHIYNLLILLQIPKISICASNNSKYPCYYFTPTHHWYHWYHILQLGSLMICCFHYHPIWVKGNQWNHHRSMRQMGASHAKFKKLILCPCNFSTLNQSSLLIWYHICF